MNQLPDDVVSTTPSVSLFPVTVCFLVSCGVSGRNRGWVGGTRGVLVDERPSVSPRCRRVETRVRVPSVSSFLSTVCRGHWDRGGMGTDERVVWTEAPDGRSGQVRNRPSLVY